MLDESRSCDESHAIAVTEKTRSIGITFPVYSTSTTLTPDTCDMRRFSTGQQIPCASRMPMPTRPKPRAAASSTMPNVWVRTASGRTIAGITAGIWLLASFVLYCPAQEMNGGFSPQFQPAPSTQASPASTVPSTGPPLPSDAAVSNPPMPMWITDTNSQLLSPLKSIRFSFSYSASCALV